MNFTLEEIEKLRERTNATYEEAKRALEDSNGDMLDALIYLERNGKSKSGPKKNQEGGFGDTMRKMWDYLIKTQFVVKKGNNIAVALPLIIFIPIVLFTNMFALIVLVLALFTGHRFRLVRGDSESNVENTINRAFDTMSKTAEDIKRNASDQPSNPGE